MKKKTGKIIALLLAVSMMLTLTACGGGSSSGSDTDQGSTEPAAEPAATADDWEGITLKFASGNPEQDPFYAIGNAGWFGKVESETGGKIKFESYFSQTLTPQENTLESTKNGLVDIGEVYAAHWGEMFPLWELFFLPYQYTWPDGYAFTHAVHEFVDSHPEYIEEVEKQDVHFILLHPDGLGQVISKEPVRTIADFKGKVINAGSNIDKQLFEKLGAAVEILPSGEVYDNLSKGTIDGAGWSMMGINIFSLPDVAKYISRLDASHQGWFYVMNNDVYNSIPDEYKHYFDFKTTEDWQYWLGYVVTEFEEAFVDSLGSKAEIITFDDAQRAELKEQSAFLLDDWKERVAAEGFDGDAIYADWQEVLAKYADNGNADYSGMADTIAGYGVEIPDYYKYNK